MTCRTYACRGVCFGIDVGEGIGKLLARGLGLEQGVLQVREHVRGISAQQPCERQVAVSTHCGAPDG